MILTRNFMLNDFANFPLCPFHYKGQIYTNAIRISKIPHFTPPFHHFFLLYLLSTARSCRNTNWSTVQISNIKEDFLEDVRFMAILGLGRYP